jgi:hypothetical protein
MKNTDEDGPDVDALGTTRALHKEELGTHDVPENANNTFAAAVDLIYVR